MHQIVSTNLFYEEIQKSLQYTILKFPIWSFIVFIMRPPLKAPLSSQLQRGHGTKKMSSKKAFSLYFMSDGCMKHYENDDDHLEVDPSSH